MEKIVNRMINDAVEGVDTYKTDGSTWLIFTETKRWVIELTKDGTLWYNYNFFKDLLVYLSMDVVENQHYITKWVEDNVINKVKRTSDLEFRNQLNVEDTIQNGVKGINKFGNMPVQDVEDIIQNGVKYTIDTTHHKNKYVEDTIQNGVKDTLFGVDPDEGRVEDTIENGVKETIDLEMDDEEVVEYFIENSVKETLNTEYMPQEMIEETIENGIKETKTPGKDGNIQSTLEWVSKNGTFSVRELIDGVIENGVKETKIGAPDNRDYFIKDTIENGVKLTNSSLQIDGSCVIEDVIKEGVKYTGGIGNPNWMGNKVETAIENGVKQTFKIQWCMEIVEEAIQKGIKNTYSDILPKEYDWSNQFDVQEVIDNGVKHTEYGDWEDGDERLDDIIQNGVKATLNDPHHRRREVVQTIKESIKETIGEDYHHKNRIDGVIKNGVKETLSSIYPIERVVEKVVEVGVLETKSMDEWVNTDYIVNKVMNNSIKEVQPLPAQDGNRDWGKYYYRKEDITKPHTKYVDDVLEKGEKI
jgi:predicted peroxiredoxin